MLTEELRDVHSQMYFTIRKNINTKRYVWLGYYDRIPLNPKL